MVLINCTHVYPHLFGPQQHSVHWLSHNDVYKKQIFIYIYVYYLSDYRYPNENLTKYRRVITHVFIDVAYIYIYISQSFLHHRIPYTLMFLLEQALELSLNRLS